MRFYGFIVWQVTNKVACKDVIPFVFFAGSAVQYYCSTIVSKGIDGANDITVGAIDEGYFFVDFFDRQVFEPFDNTSVFFNLLFGYQRLFQRLDNDIDSGNDGNSKADKSVYVEGGNDCASQHDQRDIKYYIDSPPARGMHFFSPVGVSEVKFPIFSVHSLSALYWAITYFVSAVESVYEVGGRVFLLLCTSVSPIADFLMASPFYWLLGGTSTRRTSSLGLGYQNQVFDFKVVEVAL